MRGKWLPGRLCRCSFREAAVLISARSPASHALILCFAVSTAPVSLCHNTFLFLDVHTGQIILCLDRLLIEIISRSSQTAWAYLRARIRAGPCPPLPHVFCSAVLAVVFPSRSHLCCRTIIPCVVDGLTRCCPRLPFLAAVCMLFK